MANGYGIPVLSGLLRGLSGLPEGMNQADRVNAEQARLAEQQRQFDEGRMTDLSSLAPVLGPFGVNLGGQPGQKVPTALVPTVVGAAGAQAEKTRKAQERQRLMEAAKGTPLEPYSALLGIEGGPALAQVLAGQNKPTVVGENARGIYTPSKGLEAFPESAEQAIPPGMVPSSVTRRGVTYKPPGGDAAGKTLAERVAMAREAFTSNPTPEARALLTRMEEALRVETGLAGARAGATTMGRTAAEMGAPLSATDAASLGVPFGTTQQQASGKTALTQTQRTKMDAQNAVLAIIDNLEADIKGVALPKGPGERPGAIPGAMVGVYGQTDPARTALHGRLEGTLSLIVRALGEVGTLNEGDIRRAKALMPTVAPIPDTEPVAREKLKKLRELVQEIAGRTGAAVPSRGAPAPTPAAGPVIKWGRDAQGRPIPLP